MPTLDWIGKKAVVNHHRDVPFHLLEEVPELSFGDKDSGNLLVQGDNLTALKALLPYYAGKVKCIYIDPPYNTGNESWVYNDNSNDPQIKEWLGKVVGKEAEDLSRHDKWLCMMYPRLTLLRQFLREDGIILVSIDENEHRYLELLLDEIFGACNRFETIIWKNSYGGGAKSNHIVNLHEYIACFAKNIESVENFELPPNDDVLRYYKFKDDKFEQRGPYRLQPLATNSMDSRPNLRYPIIYNNEEIWPEKQWQWSQERACKALANNELVISKKKEKWTVNYKQYLKDEEGEDRKSKPYSVIDGIYNQSGTNEVKELFGDGKAFSFPKPSLLIQQLVQMTVHAGDIVLDSFAGSGTTAHAITRLNNETNLGLRYILIEMDKDIAENITSNRLKKIHLGYDSVLNNKKTSISGFGGGFRYYRLGKPLFDESGKVYKGITFSKLARHVFFTETGHPLEKEHCDSALIGTYNNTAVYLLFNGILKDKKPDSGNVLTGKILALLPEHDGPKVIYGTACRLSPVKLREANIVFKQVPYEIKAD